MAAEDAIGYIVTVYTARGVSADRSDFSDRAKAEKAFKDAKFAAILWQSRPPAAGLGWIKLDEKEAPPPAPPAPAGTPAAPAAAKPPVAPPVAKPVAAPAVPVTA